MKFLEAVHQQKNLISAIGEDAAYLVAAVALYLEEADANALASIGLTDGADDKKIDFIYHDPDSRRLLFAQGYLSKRKADSAPANKASDLNTACAWLVSGDLSSLPTKLKTIIDDFRAALAAGEIDQIDLLYIHNLPESVNVSREMQTVEEHLRATLKNSSVLVRSNELGSSRLDHLLEQQESHIEVKDEIQFPFALGIEESSEKWTAGVSTVSGQWIFDLYSKYGDRLYSANYRGFLGANSRKKVNSGIKYTAEKFPENFWSFNNGITVLTQKIDKQKGGKGQGVVLKGISVINGAQTTGSIGSVDASKETSLGKVKLLCRVIECSDSSTIGDIVRYNNTQNAITNWDQFGNDPDQKRIADEFDTLGISYSRKRGFSAADTDIGIEQVFQPLIAFHGKPAEAVRGRNQLFLDSRLYKLAFEDKKARHVLLVYALARAIDNKRMTLKRKSRADMIDIEEKQLSLLSSLNFKPFAIAVIANSLDAVIGKRCDFQTVAFTEDVAKGQTVIALAARWAPVVDALLPLLVSLVDVDTYFKNLSAEQDFLAQIKSKLDAMLVATNTPERLKSFSELISAS